MATYKPKFAQTIVVKLERDGDVSYMVADTSFINLAELREKIRVGVYELVEVREVEGTVTTKITT